MKFIKIKTVAIESLRNYWRPVAFFSVIISLVVASYLVLHKPPFIIEIEGSGRIQKIDIGSESYETPAGKVVKAHFPYTALTLKSVKGLNAVKENGQMQLTFKEGEVLVSYSNAKHRPGLSVNSPNAKYVAEGTRFLIHSQKQGDRLVVKEGKVSVQTADQLITVPENHMWATTQPDKIENDKKAVDETLTQTLALTKEADKEPSKSDKRLKEPRHVSVYLKTGEIIRGTLVSETSDALEVRIPGLAKAPVKISRSNIEKVQQ